MRRLICTFLFTTAAFCQKDPVSRSWNQPVEPFRIVGNLYYVGATDITSFLITTPEGHFLLDGGFEETTPMIRANIEKLGFKLSDVRYILSSHAHYDHAGGIAELRRATGAKFVSSRGDFPQHARGGLGDRHFGDRFPYEPVVADRVIDDHDALTLGGVTMTAHITAGHTPGCTTWTTTADGKRVVFVCSPTVPAGYKLEPDVVADYRRQFVTLRALKPDIFLASHGNFFNLTEKITTRNFVDPEGYAEFVDEMDATFEKKIPKLVLHNATVIDGTGAPPRKNVDVVIRGETIESVGAHAEHPEGARVIDATGKFVIPGLIDMHAHVLTNVWNEKGELEPRYDRAVTLANLALYLKFGVTTVRDPGAQTADAVLIRDLVRDGKLEGPQIFTAGRILNSSNFTPEPFVIVRDEAAVREEIRWQARAGVDAIKVYSSMTPDLVRVAVDEAHRHGLPLLGHVQRTTWTEAARLGIDGLEHAAPWSVEYVREADRAAMPNNIFGRVHWLTHLDEKAIDEMIAALVEHRVVVDPTLMAMHTKFWGDDARYTANPELALVSEKLRKGWAAGRFTADWTPAQYAEAQKAWPLLLRLTKKMYDRGVRLVAGTDTPTPWIIPGASLHDELRLLADAGIPPLAILRMTTHDAAVALRRDHLFGSIRPGLRADLLLLSKDPLESIANTRSIELVIQCGQ